MYDRASYRGWSLNLAWMILQWIVAAGSAEGWSAMSRISLVSLSKDSCLNSVSPMIRLSSRPSVFDVFGWKLG